MNNLLSQISDLKFQADQINLRNAESRVKAFSKFNNELKFYLLENIKDEEILKLASQIPNLYQEINIMKCLITFLFGVLSEGESSSMKTTGKSKEILIKIKEIKDKYSSIELLLKNLTINNY